MKTAKDPRHLHRIKIIRELFTWSFTNGDSASSVVKPIISKIGEIDRLIEQSATDRPVSQINRVDLCILRLAVFELIIKKEAPAKVIVDEAVELGKEYGSDSTASFVNGALGKIIDMKGIKT